MILKIYSLLTFLLLPAFTQASCCWSNDAVEEIPRKSRKRVQQVQIIPESQRSVDYLDQSIGIDRQVKDSAEEISEDEKEWFIQRSVDRHYFQQLLWKKLDKTLFDLRGNFTWCHVGKMEGAFENFRSNSIIEGTLFLNKIDQRGKLICEFLWFSPPLFEENYPKGYKQSEILHFNKGEKFTIHFKRGREATEEEILIKNKFHL